MNEEDLTIYNIYEGDWITALEPFMSMNKNIKISPDTFRVRTVSMLGLIIENSNIVTGLLPSLLHKFRKATEKEIQEAKLTAMNNE